VQVDPASGALSHATLVSNVPNPAQLTLSADGKTLYVASEVADCNGGKHGGITAYRINPADGALAQLNQVDSQGAGPVYLS
ncbi:lactonase family protein, partial [Bacillus cereus]|uniref:lactonase family protein n=1 Tax=Bacillus cereus TaxID=1396 RepID=UPI001D1380BF